MTKIPYSLPSIYIVDCSSYDQPSKQAYLDMERLQIEEGFLAYFEAVPFSSDGNESYESVRSVSSYDSELVVSDYIVSLTPSHDHCSSLSSMLHQSENQIDRLGRVVEKEGI